MRFRAEVAAVVLATLVPALASAQSATSVNTSGDWESSLSVHGYLPSIGGSTAFPVDPGAPPINVAAPSVLDVLKMTFMATYEVHKGTWGVVTDLFYADLGNTKLNSRDFTIGNVGLPAGTTSNLKWDSKSTIWTVAGLYRMKADSAWTVDLLGGARLLDLRQRLTWTISGNLGPLTPAERSGTAEAREAVWDAVVGVKGRYAFGADHRWAVPFYADAGTGESKSTLQAATGIGYSFGWGELQAQWRYVGYNFKSGGAIHEMDFKGPQIGAVFHW